MSTVSFTDPADPLFDSGTGSARNLMLDDTGDLLVQAGQLVLVRGAPSIEQDLKCALQFFRGEWFLDESVGLPYFDDVLVKNPDPALVRSAFREAILARPGVTALQSLTLDFDSASRHLQVTFTVETDAGLLEAISVQVPA